MSRAARHTPPSKTLQTDKDKRRQLVFTELGCRLLKEFFRVTVDAPTTRNWSTVLKLQAATGGRQNAA